MGIKLIRYLPSVIWMGIIFYLSHQPASDSQETSVGLLTFMLNIIPLSTEYEMILYSIVKKLAPFLVYLILGLLMYVAYRGRDTVLLILSICLLFVTLSIGPDMDLHTLIRKLAHFFAYMFLGLLIYFAYQGNYAVAFTLTISLLFAITDEVHQLFIPGRSGEMRDVLIDVGGAAFGLIILRLINKLRRRLQL